MMRTKSHGAPQRWAAARSFEQLLVESSCNFSLDCSEPTAAATRAAQQTGAGTSAKGAHLVSGEGSGGVARLLFELRHQHHQQQNLVLLANSSDTLAASKHIKQQQQRGLLLAHFSQADAASAMVGMMRLVLVILICVLLVKLHAIPSLSGARWSSAKSSSTNQQVSSAAHKTRRRRQRANSGAEQDNHESHRATTKISTLYADKQLAACQQEQENLESTASIVNPQHIRSNLSTATTTSLYKITTTTAAASLSRRRLSQPALTGAAEFSTSAASAFNKSSAANERRRRHSDTNAIISSLQLPPGPIGLPFLGYLPFLGTEIHLTLTALSQRFGPIYQIFLGGIRVVVLNDASLVRQAFKQTVFSGRPDTQLTRILQGYGIVNSDGALWKEQRAFLHSALRKLGAKSLMSGTNGLEAKIQNQVREFVNDLSAHAGAGKPCQVRPIVARAVSSVVGSVVMNLTYRKYEEKFDRLIELMQEGFRLVSIAMPLDFIPIFRFLPGVSYAFQKMKRNRAETSAFFQTVADEHRRYLRDTFNLNVPNTASSLHPRVGQLEPTALSQPPPLPKTILTSASSITASIVRQQQQQLHQPKQPLELDNIVARDLVDAYIVQQKRHENDGKENYFSDQQLVQIMSDIFSAGLETVTSTIEWSILFLMLNPECQDKIQLEIDRVVGRARLPQLDDLAQMPYTEATIYEVLRRSNVVALGNAHATLADATIGGYRIPKGTQVLPNLYGIHMDPKLWQQPERFEPERFIVNERAQKPDYFIPFSVGRRMCLGDVLAKMEVFLFLVGLLQKYDLSVHDDDRTCPPQVKGTIGVSNAPEPFRVALRARGHSPAAAAYL